ncbi:MAG: 2-oxo acid dehydrogenase subunit E2 [Gammaproteobacteria bacterium]|nr:2-oxo acid dehydrogenase subunit E2 [Gammaproteobacteria bacterium]MDH4312312.1 2-oxo acid dehydrogenase subunit E2 [Gammaproteobacteria bacterium]MDH5272121.1 2-oxo acid dehydrogenase subunit E2 [Gammaproteobacteria bacterium]
MSEVAGNVLIEVRVPDIGNYKDVEVIEVAVKPGDSIGVEGTLITLETEKATMDVPSTTAGLIKELKVKRGARVSQGDVIAVVEAAASAAPAAASAPAQTAVAAPAPTPAREVARSAGESREREPPPQPAAPQARDGVTASAGTIDEPGFARAHASPAIRKLARELGVDLTRVQGSGEKGRITDVDVKAYVKRILSSGGAATPGAAALPRVPVVDFAAFGPVERKPLTRIQRISGPRLHASWVNLPHVTQFDEADITEMEQARGNLKQQATERGLKLTPLAFVIRACVQAMQQFPQFCASLDADAGELVYKKYVHVGFAADTPNGLVVPVVRDADRKDVFELARDLADLSEKARAGKLSAAEMQGGCFTISSLGGIGGTAFTPIINAPEVAILGVSRSAYKPVYKDGVFVPRLMMPLSLSYDHRVIDGAAAVRFTSFLAAALSDVDGLLRAIP